MHIIHIAKNSEISDETYRVSEIKDAQLVINNWLRRYDNSSYTVVCSGTGSELIAKKGNDEVSRITFANKTVNEVAGGTSSPQTSEFKNVTGVSFSITKTDKQNLIKAVVTTKKGKDTENQMLFFSMFSGISRDRQVTGKG